MVVWWMVVGTGCRQGTGGVGGRGQATEEGCQGCICWVGVVLTPCSVLASACWASPWLKPTDNNIPSP